MGFRVPLTAASAVDTRAGSTLAAGVRLYQQTNPDNGVPTGYAEWDDGIPGNGPAQIVQTSVASPRSATTPFGTFRVIGGTYNGAAAPELDLNVEQDPQSAAAVPTARLKGARLKVEQPIVRAPADGSGVVNVIAGGWGTGWGNWTGGGGYSALTLTRCPDGMIEVFGIAQWNGGASAGSLILPLGGVYAPSTRFGHLMLHASDADAVRQVDVRAGAAAGIYWRGSLPAAVGDFINIHGRYPSTEF